MSCQSLSQSLTYEVIGIWNTRVVLSACNTKMRYLRSQVNSRFMVNFLRDNVLHSSIDSLSKSEGQIGLLKLVFMFYKDNKVGYLAAYSFVSKEIYLHLCFCCVVFLILMILVTYVTFLIAIWSFYWISYWFVFPHDILDKNNKAKLVVLTSLLSYFSSVL